MKVIITLFCISCFFACQLEGKSNSSYEKTGRISMNSHQVDNPEPDDYDVKFYFVDIEVNDSSTYIHGSASILVELLDPAPKQIILDLGRNLHVDSVLLDGLKATYLHENDALIMSKPVSYATGNTVNIQVFYDGTGDTRRYFAGLYHAEDTEWGNSVTWSLSEPFSARNWFPCKQVLEDKADSVYVFITTDENLKAGSNGILTAQTKLSGGKIRHEWKSFHPIAYYLISFAVSDYRDYSIFASLSDSGDSLLIQNYIYNNDEYLSINKNNIDITADLVELYSELFGPYPFYDEKYGHCIVPSGGGMEHQTMTTLENFSFVLVSHELAHQWFGDYVTCATWQDIWINEGFASYAEYLGYQYLVSQEEADRWMRSAHDIVKSRTNGSIYIPSDRADEENRIFDYRLTYKKGAAIIHMIRHEINDDNLFFDILRDYINRYRNGSATGLDFKNLLEERSEMDFTDFFDQWYFGEGYPLLALSWQHRNDTLYITSLQSTASSTPLFNIRMDFKVTVNGKDTLITRRQNSNFEEWNIYVPGKISNFQADPDNWLVCDLTSIRIRDEINAEEDIIIRPNPSNNIVNIQTGKNNGICNLLFIDASGRILLSKELDSGDFTLDVKEYPSGVYNIVFIDQNHNLFPYKFVKD